MSSYYASQLMLHGSWHLSDYSAVLEQPASLRSLAEAVQPTLSCVQLEVIVHGNASVDEAKAVAETIGGAFETFGASPLSELSQKKITKLPGGVITTFEYDLAAENPAQENSCTQNIYQVGVVGEDLKRDACLSLMCHMAATSAFQQLRTEEQLGYIVQAGGWAEHHVSGFCVIVQGNRLAPVDVDARIEDWVFNFGRELEKVSADEFANNVRAVVSERTQRYATLAQETSRHWSEIQHRRYRFDRLPRSVEALESLTKGDVVEFFHEHVAAGAPSRRKLSLRVLGTSAGEARSEPDPNGGVVLRGLEDLRTFRDSSEAFLEPAHREMPAA